MQGLTTPTQLRALVHPVLALMRHYFDRSRVLLRRHGREFGLRRQKDLALYKATSVRLAPESRRRRTRAEVAVLGSLSGFTP